MRHKTPRDACLDRMVETIVARMREADQCDVDDLARAGFTTAEILNHRADAYALAARALKEIPA